MSAEIGISRSGHQTLRIQIRNLPLWIFIAFIVVILLLSPFLLHTYRFRSELISNQEKWSKLVTTEYEMVVASNSMSGCTAGWNTIVVRGSEIIEAHNSEFEKCSIENFEQLTVDTLFNRIWDECLRNRSLWKPFPICNVTYDEELGYPKRLDTFSFDDQGEYLPSVSIYRVSINP